MEQSQRTGIKKTASLLALLGLMLAMLLAAAAPAAFAQEGQAQQQPGATTITATGLLVGPVKDNNLDPTLEFRLTDEATGTTFELSSGFVDLGAFAGQRVTIEGVRVPGINPLAFNVTSIQSAPPGAGTATHSFELAVEGQPPANATFFGLTAGAGEGSVFVQLTDPEGDGLYTGSTTVTDIPSEVRPVAILQGTGSEPCTDGSGACPGQPITLLKDFGLVPFGGDQMFSASVSFEDGSSDNNGSGGTDTNNDGGVPSGGAQAQLPATGGVSLVVLGAVGALLVGGGLLTRVLTR